MKLLHSILCFLAITLILHSCGHSPTGGGSADSGNVKFAGILYTVSGERAPGATVTLCPFASSDSLSPKYVPHFRRTTTDDSGKFSFDSIAVGEYYIECNDEVANAVVLKVKVSEDDEQDIFRRDTLRPYASISGSIGSSSSVASKRYLTVHGLDRKKEIDVDGNFYMNNLPAGIFRFSVEGDDSTFSPPPIKEYSLMSGKTLFVPYHIWEHSKRIYLNTTKYGADISGMVTGFPVLVRLSEDNFDFSEASSGGTDCRFTSADGVSLDFEIERWDTRREIGEIWVKIDTVYGNDDTRYFKMFWGNTASQVDSVEGAVFDTSDGFQGVWHLSDTVVEVINDATDNGYKGTANGMSPASTIEGIIGKAREFDGVTTSIVIDNSADSKLNFPENGFYSLSAWVYARTLDSVSHVVLSKGDEQYFLCSVNGTMSAPTWEFVEFRDRIGWQSCSGSASDDRWVMLTGVTDGNSHLLYINGELVDSTHKLLASTKSRITDFDVAIGMFLESGDKEGDSYFKGYIDEVRMHDRAVSRDWIKLCYMNQRADDHLLKFLPDNDETKEQ